MNNLEITLLENRIHLLTQRDPVGNAKIIKKLERRLRASRKCIRGLRAKIAYIDQVNCNKRIINFERIKNL